MRTIFVALLLVGCSKPAPTPPPLPEPIESASPARVVAPTYEASAMRLEGDVLEECVDVAIDVTPPTDAGPDWRPKDDPTDLFMSSVKSMTRIPQKCAGQFADRTALATCDVSKDVEQKTGAVMHVRVRSAFYPFERVGLSDLDMKDCLEMKGEWRAIPRSSREWQDAKLDHARRAVAKIAR